MGDFASDEDGQLRPARWIYPDCGWTEGEVDTQRYNHIEMN